VAPKGTHFHTPIGLGSTWDPALLERVMSAAAAEARARGCQHVLSPVVDLARDPRWGRTEETYGEDPFLVARLGVAAVRGYQGTRLPLADGKVFATLKHFAGHGSHEGGINVAPPAVSERLLREQLLLPFEAAVREAKAYSVMPSYNEIDGVPSHKNRWLIEQVLRREWGFGGFVASDYFAIAELCERHQVASDHADAARQALETGVDLELPDTDGYGHLPELVKAGRVSEAAVDRSVARVLKAKFLAGLFERPNADPTEAERAANTPAHQALALEAARESIVLLKNDAGLLPLDRNRLKTLAVIGPNAKGLHLGGYSSNPGRGVDVFDGIQAAAGAGVRLTYSEGTRITEQPADWNADKVELGDPAKNRERIAAAAAVAKAADAIVLVLGTNESTSREAWADNHLGDVADLGLMGQQEELFDAVRQTGKPLVVVYVNGRPVASPNVAKNAVAILETWYAGQEGGTAIGEVLFGDTNPSGRLPISIPRASGQLPIAYNRKPTSFRSYLDLTREPQWAFGYGQSYTSFQLGSVSVDPPQIGPSGRASVSVEIANTGRRDGVEVVQLYVHPKVASTTRPIWQLRGFERVALRVGEKRTATFTLGPDTLWFLDEDMKRVVEPGTIELLAAIGTTHTRATLQVAAR
jgi:beta-glucosidase